MEDRIARAVQALGEEGFVQRMEELTSSERREIFDHLDVPAGGASASARERTLRRIHLAWGRLEETMDEEVAETFARAWLARSAMGMIIEFLDRMGVAHEGGYLKEVEVLQKLGAGEAAAVLKELAVKHDPGDVRLYAALMDLPGADAFKA